jgi:N-acetylmuramoyl-L-alanine amidase
MSKLHIIVDAGHGGNSPYTGEYMTRKDWGKYYRFLKADNKTLDFEVREGVTNRLIANKFCELLGKAGYSYTKIYHEYLDTHLELLSSAANKIAAEQNKLGNKAILLSFHSNASGNSFQGQGALARGVSFWTTKGKTKSDQIADIWFEEHKKVCGNLITHREERSDGDHDYEEEFWIIKQTIMPAVLIENLFFDNREDAKILLSESYQDMAAKAALAMVQRVEKEVKL